MGNQLTGLSPSPVVEDYLSELSGLVVFEEELCGSRLFKVAKIRHKSNCKAALHFTQEGLGGRTSADGLERRISHEDTKEGRSEQMWELMYRGITLLSVPGSFQQSVVEADERFSIRPASRLTGWIPSVDGDNPRSLVVKIFPNPNISQLLWRYQALMLPYCHRINSGYNLLFFST
ncbi:unnamed protein product [Schistosoma mattheei]|uniref:Uncharacterized protein n=1 Tax=Schistosoma mattheei TaxID=31246 RepID=A0A183PTW1_9TREM|nr:unnamed protein product [Schistosoma mattheei]